MFAGERATIHRKVEGVRPVRIKKCKHSGQGAIALAVQRGAVRVGLLGYDCQYSDGKKHWHGDHPRKLGNAATVNRWVGHLQELAAQIRGVEVINMTRKTAIKHWPRVSLEQFIQGDKK